MHTKPHTSYLVCATPRSGSSLLCEALKGTGVAGRPEEYFWCDDERFWKERWGVSNYADYLAKTIEQGTTPNGVFGAKIMWGYIDDFVSKLRTITDYETMSVPDMLSTIFPNLHYIWITRRDTVRQAVSFSRAIQSGMWVETVDDPHASRDGLAFDFEQIDHLVREIEAHQQAWRHYFAEARVQPFTVVYEELVLHYRKTALDTLHSLNIAVPEPLVFVERRLRKQADPLSDEWVRRYKELSYL